MTVKADSRLAEFLRRVRAGGNDAAPTEVIFGQDSPTTDMQQTMAEQFASSVRDLGYIEPTGGADGDLRRVRVTQQGQEWLDEYDRREPGLHPRYSS